MARQSLHPENEDDFAGIIGALVAQIEGCAHASVLVRDGDVIRVAATSDASIDDALGSAGPAHVAFARRCAVRVHSTRTCAEYGSGFVRACEALDIRSLAAFPIRGAEHEVAAVLMLTSHDHFGFGTRELKTARDAVSKLTPLEPRPLASRD